MNKPELIIIFINLLFIIPAYFYVYPKFAGSNLNKIAVYGLIISIMVLIITGFLFYGKGIQFDIIFTHLNWFWFTLVTFALLELNIMFWYNKKYAVMTSYLTK